MPSITLTFDATQATRIAAALSATPYPATVPGYKQLLVDYTKDFVQQHEKAKAEKAALAAVAAPVTVDIS